jgi:hypothetical protein
LSAVARVFRWFDGSVLEPVTKVATVRGQARHILLGERTALNLIARCSGIATRARQYVQSAASHGWKGPVHSDQSATSHEYHIDALTALEYKCELLQVASRARGRRLLALDWWRSTVSLLAEPSTPIFSLSITIFNRSMLLL